MDKPGKNTARWRHLTNGYNKYWYSKAALRWLALTAAVVGLITFGASWHDYAHYSDQPYVLSLNFNGFTIAGVCLCCTLPVQFS